MAPGPWFNIKMTSYQYRKSHCGDETVVRSSYLHNGISYTGKTTSLYWIKAQATSMHKADHIFLVMDHIHMISFHLQWKTIDNRIILFDDSIVQGSTVLQIVLLGFILTNSSSRGWVRKYSITAPFLYVKITFNTVIFKLPRGRWFNADSFKMYLKRFGETATEVRAYIHDLFTTPKTLDIIIYPRSKSVKLC